MTVIEALRVTTESIKSWVESKFLKKTDIDAALSTTSENPVQNKVINTEIENLKTAMKDIDVSEKINEAIGAIDYPVDSVNNKTGAVILTADDLGVYVQDAEPTEAVDGDIWVDTANDPSAMTPNVPVTSVNGMTGDVVIEIPEGFSGSWNDLVDKPFYEEGEQTTITWDGNTEGRDSLVADFMFNVSFYKVSDLLPTKDELIGATVTLDTTTTITESSFAMADENATIAEAFIVVYGTAFSFNSAEYTVPSPGIYFPNMGNTYTTLLAYGSSSIVQLDEKFIPDTIARIRDLPVGLPDVTTADNGKVLMVVDGTWTVVDINLTVDADGALSV